MGRKKKPKAKRRLVKVKVKVKRDIKGQFLPGTPCPNPLGRPVIADTSLDYLLAAVRRNESKLNKNLLDHYIARAFKSDVVLISIMRKLHPDLQAVAVMNADSGMTEAEANEIRERLKERFGKQLLR